MNIFPVRDYPQQAPNSPSDYELLDFGRGRKLERFGPLVVDRPAAGLEQEGCESPHLWPTAQLCFQREAYDLLGHPGSQPAPERPQREGTWYPSNPTPWSTTWGGFTLELRPTTTGQLGVFPEQQPNWHWLRQQVRRMPHPCHVLNLFAYTGGSSLAVACEGAAVVHVDAQRRAVEWGRTNALRSQLNAAPIRWIVEDARKYVQRELRRARRYHGIILDPPSYGHGRAGEMWKLERDLPALLQDCLELWHPEQRFLLLSCHTPGWPADRLRELIPAELLRTLQAEACELRLETVSGRAIPSGATLRVASKSMHAN